MKWDDSNDWMLTRDSSMSGVKQRLFSPLDPNGDMIDACDEPHNLEAEQAFLDLFASSDPQVSRGAEAQHSEDNAKGLMNVTPNEPAVVSRLQNVQKIQLPSAHYPAQAPYNKSTTNRVKRPMNAFMVRKLF